MSIIDTSVLIIYLIGIIAFGCMFSRKNETSQHFMSASGSLPGWAVGLSIFGTYLSSNSFVGIPGKSFGADWSPFVFSISIPITALIAAKFFVPFYRKSGEISAYEHFEKRFGPWARNYASVCYLLSQVARMGAVMFGVSLVLSELLGWNLPTIIIFSGVSVTVYTLLGGIEAVIWTDVIQSIILILGSFLILSILLIDMPGGAAEGFSYAWNYTNEAGIAQNKFSLGNFNFDFLKGTFWIILFYGVFENMKNFGIDQSFVQRYQTAKSDREALKSLWLGSLLYVPVSLIFVMIGTLMFSYYHKTPAMLKQVKKTAVVEALSINGITSESFSLKAYKNYLKNQTKNETESNSILISAGLDKNLGYEDIVKTENKRFSEKNYGDKILPHFIMNKLPVGIAGLLIAAIFAAAMSSIDTSLNSSATIVLNDIYKRYINPNATEKQCMKVLRVTTVCCGVVGILISLMMIGVKSVLDAWWTLAGIFSGALLGLFLLGIIIKKAKSAAAGTAVILGVIIVFYLSLAVAGDKFPVFMQIPESMRPALHGNMIIVIGTLSIFFIGMAASKIIKPKSTIPEQ